MIVLLLHDQFQNQRIWGRFESELAEHVTVRTVRCPADVYDESLPFELLAKPDNVMAMAHLGLAIAPYYDELTNEGTLPAEGVEAFMSAIMPNIEGLTRPDMNLIRDVFSEELRGSFPLDTDLEAQLGDPSSQGAWAWRIQDIVDKCTVVFGHSSRPDDELAGVLQIWYPDIEIIDIDTPTASSWLRDPGRLRDLVLRLGDV